MLINVILYNSEAWHGLTEEHIKPFHSCDEDFLRRVLKAHAKTPHEFLHLDTRAVSIYWILDRRMINFLKCIINKDITELLLKKVYEAKKMVLHQGILLSW